MDINLEDLRLIVDKLLSHIVETRDIKHVELGADGYWDLPEEALYNLKIDPKEYEVGSLEDDWEFISSLLSDDAQPVAYQLTEVAPILRRIGEVLGRQLAANGG